MNKVKLLKKTSDPKILEILKESVILVLNITPVSVFSLNEDLFENEAWKKLEIFIRNITKGKDIVYWRDTVQG